MQLESQKFKARYSRFCVQPHQGFCKRFLLIAAFGGIIATFMSADVSMLLQEYHAYAFVFAVFIQFFLGFLFVVFPRFLVQAAITSYVYMCRFWAYFVISWGLVASFLMGAQSMILFFTSVKFADYNINKSKFLIEKIYAFLLLKLTGSVLGAGVELIAGSGLCMIFVFELWRWQLPILRVEAIL